MKPPELITIHNPPYAADTVTSDSVRFWNRWHGPELVDDTGRIVAVWNVARRQWERPKWWNDGRQRKETRER